MLSGLCIFTMFWCIGHVLYSQTLASSPIFITILVSATTVSAVAVTVMAMPKDEYRAPAVASWLASTAKSRGYPADLLSGASSHATGLERSKRLKGKARTPERKQLPGKAPYSKTSGSR